MQIDASEQIEKFKEFLHQEYEKAIYEAVRKGNYALNIDFSHIMEFDHELADQLLEEPEETIKAIELSIESFDINKSLRARVYNISQSQYIMVRDIRSNHLGKFMFIEGIVRQSSDVRPQITSAKFECPSCGNSITILQLDTKFKEPTRCSCGRRGKFRLIGKELVDAQRLVIEEAPEALEGGEQPKRLSIFLKEDLVEPKMEKKTTPGSKIRVTGVVKEVPITLRTGAQSIRYDLMMESNHIEPIEETFSDIEIDEGDEKKIIELSKDPKIYEKLTNAIAPSIYGHERVKEAIILQLMGGVRKMKEDGTITRGDMHILLVGDPGAAKSSILQFVSKAAPKARFVSGKGVSGAGLTASVVKDEFLKGWALEAGALVLANGGCCCIDELDKMSPEDRSAMHEAMEQQQISISKANIQATLRAQTTILAAANPKYGRFDPYSPIAAQIDLPPALINRFDLIFPIRDIPNKEMDEKIASHVLRLQQKPEQAETEISTKILRKYIAYARQKASPILTDSAVDEIKKFYVALRNSNQTGEEEIKPIPISARQLEALVRLAEGAAKLRLSKKVTRSDAKKSIILLKHCLMQVGIDPETGKIDIDRISTGIPASQRSRIVVVREIIKSLELKMGKSIPIQDIIADASLKGIDEAQVEEVIEKLSREGFIFQPKRDTVSVLD
ncbi:MAG: minichromosome maintenance protein MCM [Nanoarchaeota archaeon]|nr:minichromosome maintenance protein MCM [Nanoarchaeota archaeon]